MDEREKVLEDLINNQTMIIELQDKLIKNLKSNMDWLQDKILHSEGNEKMCRWAAEEARDMIKEYDRMLLSLGKKDDRAQSQKWLAVFGD